MIDMERRAEGNDVTLGKTIRYEVSGIKCERCSGDIYWDNVNKVFLKHVCKKTEKEIETTNKQKVIESEDAE